MPHWDFECENEHRWDMAFASHAEMKEKSAEGFLCPTCRQPLELCPSSPATFRVYGFNALNHYGAKQMETVKQHANGIKTITREYSEPNKGFRD